MEWLTAPGLPWWPGIPWWTVFLASFAAGALLGLFARKLRKKAHIVESG